MVGGADHAVSTCASIFRALAPGIGSAPRTDDATRATSFSSMVGYVVEDLVQVIL